MQNGKLQLPFFIFLRRTHAYIKHVFKLNISSSFFNKYYSLYKIIGNANSIIVPEEF